MIVGIISSTDRPRRQDGRGERLGEERQFWTFQFMVSSHWGGAPLPPPPNNNKAAIRRWLKQLIEEFRCPRLHHIFRILCVHKSIFVGNLAPNSQMALVGQRQGQLHAGIKHDMCEYKNTFIKPGYNICCLYDLFHKICIHTHHFALFCIRDDRRTQRHVVRARPLFSR